MWSKESEINEQEVRSHIYNGKTANAALMPGLKNIAIPGNFLGFCALPSNGT